MLRAQTPAHLCPQDNRFSSEWPINPGSAVALRRSVVRFRFDVPPIRVLYRLHYLTPRIARSIVVRRRQTRALYVYRALRSRERERDVRGVSLGFYSLNKFLRGL